MARPPEEGLTSRESQIMNALWSRGEATVEEIRGDLPGPPAGSTLRTLLQIMHNKGYVGFHKRGKAKVYRPLAAREEVQTSALHTLTARLFQGSAGLLLARLVEEEEISLDELDALRRRLRRRQKGDPP
ncbi:MAG: BlaI/MecI/CopY family transcriptional regulator [Candidatus Latescibacterota bacterium]